MLKKISINEVHGKTLIVAKAVGSHNDRLEPESDPFVETVTKPLIRWNIGHHIASLSGGHRTGIAPILLTLPMGRLAEVFYTQVIFILFC